MHVGNQSLGSAIKSRIDQHAEFMTSTLSASTLFSEQVSEHELGHFLASRALVC